MPDRLVLIWDDKDGPRILRCFPAPEALPEELQLLQPRLYEHIFEVGDGRKGQPLRPDVPLGKEGEAAARLIVAGEEVWASEIEGAILDIYEESTGAAFGIEILDWLNAVRFEGPVALVSAANVPVQHTEFLPYTRRWSKGLDDGWAKEVVDWVIGTAKELRRTYPSMGVSEGNTSKDLADYVRRVRTSLPRVRLRGMRPSDTSPILDYWDLCQSIATGSSKTRRVLWLGPSTPTDIQAARNVETMLGVMPVVTPGKESEDFPPFDGWQDRLRDSINPKYMSSSTSRPAYVLIDCGDQIHDESVRDCCDICSTVQDDTAAWPIVLFLGECTTVSHDTEQRTHEYGVQLIWRNRLYEEPLRWASDVVERFIHYWQMAKPDLTDWQEKLEKRFATKKADSIFVPGQEHKLAEARNCDDLATPGSVVARIDGLTSAFIQLTLLGRSNTQIMGGGQKSRNAAITVPSLLAHLSPLWIPDDNMTGWKNTYEALRDWLRFREDRLYVAGALRKLGLIKGPRRN